MYCSTCGAAVTRGLNYCKQCGARLGGAKGEEITKAEEASPESLVRVIASVFVLGLFVTTIMMAVMKKLLNFNEGLIIAFTLLILLLMATIEGVFIWLLLSRRRGARGADEAGRLKEPGGNELGGAPPRLLPDQTPSVTEPTTRSFDPVYSERKSS